MVPNRPPDEHHPLEQEDKGFYQEPDLDPLSESKDNVPRQLIVRSGSTNRLQAYVVQSSSRAFQRDIYFYWSTAHAHPLSLTKEGRLYKKDLRLVNAALLQPLDLDQENEPDVPRLLFLRLLLTELKLLECTDQTVHAVDHPWFLATKPHERIEIAFTRWRDSTFWNEVLSIPDISITDLHSRLEPAPEQLVRSRKRVLSHIAAASQMTGDDPPVTSADTERQRWVSIQRLIEWIRANDYNFLLSRDYAPSQFQYYRTYHNYLGLPSPYISYGNEMGWSFSPPFSDEAEGWNVVEAGFIRAILLEPLHWMGLLDIGYLDDQPIAYRLTPAGAWVLGVGPQLDIPKEDGRVVVQPNFELFALDPISDLTLSKLDEFAERVSAERAIKYRLTRESVYRAQVNGWSASRIIDTLRDLCYPDGIEPDRIEPDPLPQNVTRTLQEWQTLHERITIHRRANLLQAVDGQLLAQLLENPSINVHLTTRAGAPEAGTETEGTAAAFVSSALGAPEALVRALEKAGYPPMRTRSPKDALRPSLIASDDRVSSRVIVSFDIALPSIYLLEQLAPFTSCDPDDRSESMQRLSDRCYITQSSMQAAQERGMSADDVLDRLRTLHYGPLPRSVERRIRAWSHYYGDAAIQTVTLIQIQDETTFQELLSDPRLQAIVQPFAPADERTLACVRAQDLDSLYEILVEYGMAIHDRLE